MPGQNKYGSGLRDRSADLVRFCKLDRYFHGVGLGLPVSRRAEADPAVHQRHELAILAGKKSQLGPAARDDTARQVLA